jgi:hypothetical protein
MLIIARSLWPRRPAIYRLLLNVTGAGALLKLFAGCGKANVTTNARPLPDSSSNPQAL